MNNNKNNNKKYRANLNQIAKNKNNERKHKDRSK